MSTIGQALNNWLQRQGASILRQATICDAFPPRTREAMISISVDSARKEREMGAAITHDYTLGTVFTGTRERVPIPRPEGTIGTYHTHPFGWARPSLYDLLDSLRYDDKVMCIGASGKPGTKIQCFTPKEPKWSGLRDKATELFKDIMGFNKKVSDRYKERGLKLRKLLGEVRPEYLEEGIRLERRRQSLIDELDKQLIYTGYKEEWRPQRKVNGWEPEPIMLDSCRIIWETLEEELPYEW